MQDPRVILQRGRRREKKRKKGNTAFSKQTKRGWRYGFMVVHLPRHV